MLKSEIEYEERALRVACPTCHRGIGLGCVSASGRATRKQHSDRHNARIDRENIAFDLQRMVRHHGVDTVAAVLQEVAKAKR
jgi:hypothetical protein